MTLDQQTTPSSVDAGGRIKDGYDGRSAFDACAPESAVVGPPPWQRVTVTIALVVGPFAGFALAGYLAWGRAISLFDVVLAVALYVVTGLGITLGYHRGATHRAFRPSRAVAAVTVAAGSMAYQGPIIEWVATHRRHHAFTDRPGDPHSPYRYGTGAWAQTRGLLHAHAGWFLRDDPTSAERYAPDLLADPLMRRLNAAFPLLCVVSLAIPFLAGWLVAADIAGGVTALLWAGLARIALLQHVTWSVNSLCHMVGERPYETRAFDRATNLWPLAVLSLGESWHNGHHSDPRCARHGRGRHQVDVSALAIKGLERLGWVTRVHWPTSTPRRG